MLGEFYLPQGHLHLWREMEHEEKKHVSVAADLLDKHGEKRAKDYLGDSEPGLDLSDVPVDDTRQFCVSVVLKMKARRENRK